MAGQDNITHDGTCLNRIKGGDRTYLYTYTPTILIILFYYYVIYN